MADTAINNTAPKTCDWRQCPRHEQVQEGGTKNKVKVCTGCQNAYYCSPICQKKAWRFHKLTCVPPDTPTRIVLEKTVVDVQSALDAAPEGSIVKLVPGEYSGDDCPRLTLKKALRIVGDGADKVKLCCNFTVAQEQVNGGKVVVTGLTIAGAVNVQAVSYDAITFASVEVRCPRSHRDDAFTLSNNGKVTLDCCEIVGGSDGLFISGENTDALIRETDIQLAQSRGIFANPSFTIQDSAVYNCGSYGIKGRSGWIEKGNNQIQPGPWSSFGGPSGGGGGYGFGF